MNVSPTSIQSFHQKWKEYGTTANLKDKIFLSLETQLTDWLTNGVFQSGIFLPGHIQLRKQVTDQPKEYGHITCHYLRQVKVPQSSHQHLKKKCWSLNLSAKGKTPENKISLCKLKQLFQSETEVRLTCSSGLLRSSRFRDPATTRTDFIALKPQS